MKRLTKQTREHNIFEVWNEDVAESVYFIGNPNSDQVKELVLKNWWHKRICGDATMEVEQYIKSCVHVEKLPHVFCGTAAAYLAERGEE